MKGRVQQLIDRVVFGEHYIVIRLEFLFQILFWCVWDELALLLLLGDRNEGKFGGLLFARWGLPCSGDVLVIGGFND